MKVRKKPMTLSQKIFYFVSFLILIGAFIFLGTRDYKVRDLPDNILFNKEYKNVPTDNTFMVLDSAEALTFLEKGTGILFLAFPENIWSAPIAELLYSACKEASCEEINYFNFLSERENRHTNYEGIVRELNDYLKTDDLGKLDVHAPLVVAVLRGKVIFFDNDTAFMNNKLLPKDYWTEEQKDLIKNEFIEMMETLKGMQANGKK